MTDRLKFTLVILGLIMAAIGTLALIAYGIDLVFGLEFHPLHILTTLGSILVLAFLLID
jgi:hypothetical protein